MQQTLWKRTWRVGVALAAAGALATLAAPAAIAEGLSLMPENVVNLSASASTELPNDRLTIVLGVRREGPDASALQAQLAQALDAALA
jgi:predicted secreted protein